MANILLIKASNIKKHYPSVTYPLGLMYLASYLREKGGHTIKIIDTRVSSLDLNDFRPDVVGISALTIEAESLYRIAGFARKRFGETKIIVGGPHASSYPQEVLSHHEIDFVGIGEGEETLHNLVSALDHGRSTHDIRGIGFMNEGSVHITEPSSPITHPEVLPFPAWDLVDIDAYSKFNTAGPIGKRRYMNIFSSRACPYRCIYCHNIFGKGFYPRSPENVLKEIELVNNTYRITNFEFVDDTFNFDIQRAENIMDLIVEKGLQISLLFPNGLRGDRLPERLLRKMKRAGTIHLGIAVETASPRLQNLIRKKLDLRKAAEAIRVSTNLGILTSIHMMLGFPTESHEEAHHSIDFAVTSPAHICAFSILVPFPGTPVSREYKNLVERFTFQFADYDYDAGNFNLSSMTDEELFGLHRYGYRKFYLNPRRLLSLFTHHPKKRYIISYLFLVGRKAFMRHILQ